MSPPGVGVFEAGIAVVERDPSVESLVNLDFGTGKAEAPGLRGDLQAAPVPLHDVVVADDTFVGKTANAVEVFGSQAPSFGGVARRTSEAAVVVSDEAAQDAVGGAEIAGPSQAEFTGEAILEHAPEALDAALGLRALRGDEGDAELLESAAELSGLAFSSKLFFDRPVIVVADKDAAAIAVEGQGDAAAAEQAVEQVEIAFAGFGGEELGGENFAGGVILHAQSGEERAAACEPVMRGAIELDEFAFAGGAQTALAMSGRAALSGRGDAFATQQTAQGLAAEGEAFLLDELLREVMIVEAGVAGAGQSEDASAHAVGQAAVTGAAAAGVSQSRCAALPITGFEAFDVPRREVEQLRGSGTRQVSLHTAGNDFHSLQLFLTQRACLLSHGVTFSRCR